MFDWARCWAHNSEPEAASGSGRSSLCLLCAECSPRGFFTLWGHPTWGGCVTREMASSDIRLRTQKVLWSQSEMGDLPVRLGSG